MKAAKLKVSRVTPTHFWLEDEHGTGCVSVYRNDTRQRGADASLDAALKKVFGPKLWAEMLRQVEARVTAQ